LLCCVTVAAGVVLVPEDAEAFLRDALAAALAANQEMADLAAELREENARLRAENAAEAAELGELRAGLAVLQRMVFDRSSEKSPAGIAETARAGGGGRGRGPGGGITRTCPSSR